MEYGRYTGISYTQRTNGEVITTDHTTGQSDVSSESRSNDGGVFDASSCPMDSFATKFVIMEELLCSCPQCASPAWIDMYQIRHRLKVYHGDVVCFSCMHGHSPDRNRPSSRILQLPHTVLRVEYRHFTMHNDL